MRSLKWDSGEDVLVMGQSRSQMSPRVSECSSQRAFQPRFSREYVMYLL